MPVDFAAVKLFRISDPLKFYRKLKSREYRLSPFRWAEYGFQSIIQIIVWVRFLTATELATITNLEYNYCSIKFSAGVTAKQAT